MNILNRLLWTAAGTAVGHFAGQLMGNTEEEKKEFSKNGRVIGGLSSLGLTFVFEKQKDTVNYTLKYKGKLVYHGITRADRLDRRISEHEIAGKVFDEVKFDAPKMRAKAMNLERFRIKKHTPKYNIHHNC